MRKWNEIPEPVEFGEFKNIEVGGYEAKIVRAYEDETLTFRPRLNIEIDITSGEFKGFFQELYDNDERPDKKWSKAGIYSVFIDDDEKTSSYTKGLLTVLENSNNIKIEVIEDEINDKYLINLGSLIGLKLGVIIGLEEYDKDGEIKLARKIRFVRSLKKDSDITKSNIPSVKTLKNGYVDYDDYMEKKEINNSIKDEKKAAINDDEMPF